MAFYQFDTGAIPTCGKVAGAYYRIELTTQTITDAAWVGGLTKPDWSGSATVRKSPFTFSEITVEGAPDAGQMSIGDISFEAHNRLLLDGSGAVTADRMSTILGVDKETTAIHIRIGWKATSGGTYVWKFWGTVQWDSLEVIYGALDNPSTWVYKFSVADTITQLDSRTFAQFADDYFAAATYFLAATNQYITFIGDSGHIAKGAHAVTYVVYRSQNADGSQRVDAFNANVTRYVRLKDLVQAFSDYLGLGTNVNGSTLGALVGNQYGYNTAASGSTTMQWVGLDSLYIHAGIFETYYRSEGSFFDYTTGCAHAFRNLSSAMDVLKKICQSVGYVCRITIDGSSERQLSVVPMTSATSSLTITASTIAADSVLKPYARAINGAQATVPSGTNVVRGANGGKCVNIDCMFSSCNNVRTSTTFGSGAIVGTLDLGPDRLTALYATTASPSGTTVATMYSVCAIAMYSGTSPAPSTSMIDPWGKYQTASPFALNTVMYPNDADPYNAWVEVPGMALAHILYSNKIGDHDISVYRDKGMEFQLVTKGITGVLYYPGDLITVTINSSALVWRVKSYRETMASDKREFILERYA